MWLIIIICYNVSTVHVCVCVCVCAHESMCRHMSCDMT